MKKSIFSILNAHRAAIFAAIFISLIVCAPFEAHAGKATDPKGDKTVPWSSGLSELVNILSGPTALFISMLGLFFAGGILIFGGELGNFTRMLMMVIIVGSSLTGISTLVLKFVPNASGCVLF
ncbi:MAG: TrbC/VirB2 family protein [Synergistales bacterium]|nr:TrbC/VirB2 family protein [Synergistales bacterium]MDY6401694.1 TrbC/VirB2 family protein [Synergistales bacterium]MDY6404502.1 TrbC/VirB2 family protein [Synergistales bacterium]MDY6410574.1 TrbC/VirB2 family protein [Synergistales bacterium]MDY6413673.1 TrbC/VirB2 family protein [Synergistales bacterium]